MLYSISINLQITFVLNLVVQIQKLQNRMYNKEVKSSLIGLKTKEIIINKIH